MILEGETLINAPRERVWAALIDPALLARCIDGVESLEEVAPNRFDGILNAKVGPVKAKFSGHVELQELDPPTRYVLSGEGKGGVAGFARGTAEVLLSDVEGGTRLAYVAKPQVGGKLAQLGTRLIEGAAKGYAENFFSALKAEIETAADASVEPAPTMPIPGNIDQSLDVAPTTDGEFVVAPQRLAGLPPWLWVGALVVLVVLVVALVY